MAGDWIKIENSLPDKPEVWEIASALDMDPDMVTGKLLRIWIWFDEHSEKGNAPSVTKKLLDRQVSVTGFCDQVIAAGWMLEGEDGIELPNFDRHNSKTAKKRALTAKRVAEFKAKSNAPGNAEVTPTALPREEKRREEEKKRPTFSDDDLQVATDMFHCIQVINPNMKEPKLETWANTIRLIRERDGKTAEEITDLFMWANRHDFWHKNILSPEKLRKQWDTLVVQRRADDNGGGRTLRLPRDDEKLVSFASSHKLPAPNPGENFPQYRSRLNSEIERRAG